MSQIIVLSARVKKTGTAQRMSYIITLIADMFTTLKLFKIRKDGKETVR